MLTVAYLGPEGTNTHLAALKRFGRRTSYLHAPTVDDVFHLVERRRAGYGVVPIENSLEGAVTRTLDRFIDFVDTPVKIQGEIQQPIRHHLIVHKRVDNLRDIKIVFSHPQALAQCRSWLDKHLPDASCEETNSTAEAVDHLLEEKGVKVLKGPQGRWRFFAAYASAKQRAAIARAELITRGNLRAIPIADQRDNKTRFLVLGLGEPRQGRENKTSILFALKDKPGALHDALVPFKRQRINLTKIESRPSKRKAWEYLFFIHIEGHESEPRVKRALNALEDSTSLLRILGSYPTATR